MIQFKSSCLPYLKTFVSMHHYGLKYNCIFSTRVCLRMMKVLIFLNIALMLYICLLKLDVSLPGPTFIHGDIPHFQITLQHGAHQNGLLNILRFICPNWNIRELNVEELKRGNSNYVYKISESNGDNDDAVVFRIKKYKKDNNLFNNITRERTYLGLVNSHNIGVPVLATFENGIVMEFAQGRHLHSHNMTEMEWKLLVQSIAKLHKVRVPHDMLESARKDRAFILNSIVSGIEVYSQRKDTILKALEDPGCICHGDLHLENFMYNEGHVSMLDFETIFYGLASLDLAQFFLHSHAGQFAFSDADKMGKPVECKDFKMNLLQMYLEHSAVLQGKPRNIVTESDVNKLYNQVIQMEYFVQLHMPFNTYYCDQ